MATIHKLVYGKSQDFQADTSNEAWKIMKGPFGYWMLLDLSWKNCRYSYHKWFTLLKKADWPRREKTQKNIRTFFRRCCVFFSASEDVFQKYFEKTYLLLALMRWCRMFCLCPRLRAWTIPTISGRTCVKRFDRERRFDPLEPGCTAGWCRALERSCGTSQPFRAWVSPVR